MRWEQLTEEAQLEKIKEQSFQQPVVIFKHSTRCSISAMALNRVERADTPTGAVWYFLDLLKHRNISNKIAEMFQVHHESPQVLLIKHGECIYDESHNGIQMEEIQEVLESN